MNTTPFPLADVAERYDDAAHDWHAHLQRLGFPKAYSGALAHLDALPGDAHVLDAGVGTGALSLALAEHVPDIRVTGVDLSHTMLREASRNLAKADISARLIQGDIRALLLESESCDAVLCAHVLEHLPQPRAALAEFRRVLKPGASLFLSVTKRGLLGTYIARHWKIKPYRPGEVLGLLEDTGFQNARFVPFSGLLPPYMSLALIAEKGEM